MRADFGRALQRARRHGYALPAFNFDNLAVLQAIIAGAEAERAPVIVMSTEGAVRHLGVDQVIAMTTVARRQARVPVLFHFDHGQSLDLARYFVDHGADSVMLDWFLRSVAANTTGTQQLVRYAHQRRGVRGSGRPCGGGKEDDRDTQVTNFTDPLVAQRFVTATNVDALGVAVGTAHGIYWQAVHLQYDFNPHDRRTSCCPLVLRGTSGVPAAAVQRAIRCGIVKVNVGTAFKLSYARALRTWLGANPQGYDARQFERAARTTVQQVVVANIRMCGANQQAQTPD